MLPVGVIGAGPEWDGTWRPALAAQSRLKIAAIYDPVAVRGEAVARELETPLFGSVRDLFAQSTLKGLVVLDAGWLGAWVIREAVKHRTPVFVARGAIHNEDLAAIPEDDLGHLLVQPDMRRRYTPATMRLRELTATKLGGIDFVGIEAPRNRTDVAEVAELIDWCRFVVQSAVAQVETEWAESESGPSRRIKLAFRKASAGQPVAAEVKFSGERQPLEIDALQDFVAEVACRAGTASIRGNRAITWRTTEAELEELLSDDRTSAHVQLDLFGRRLVGGLVPVATLDDLRTATTHAANALNQLG
jgi:hypothetical protein